MRDLVAFAWIPFKLKSGILLPEEAYKAGMRQGHTYIGKVLGVGPLCKGVKPKKYIVVSEYGIKGLSSAWKEGEIYFIEEKFIKGIVTDPSSVLGFKPE